MKPERTLLRLLEAEAAVKRTDREHERARRRLTCARFAVRRLGVRP